MATPQTKDTKFSCHSAYFRELDSELATKIKNFNELHMIMNPISYDVSGVKYVMNKADKTIVCALMYKHSEENLQLYIVTQLATAIQYQGRGYANSLMKELQTLCVRDKKKAIHLQAVDESIQWYKNRRFIHKKSCESISCMTSHQYCHYIWENAACEFTLLSLLSYSMIVANIF